MPASSIGKNRWVKGETRSVLGGSSRVPYMMAPSRASESVYSDDLSSNNGSYRQDGHFGAHAGYQAAPPGARGYRNGRANYVANASSFTLSACSHAGKAAVMVCIVIGAAFLAFGGDVSFGDVYSKLAPSAKAFTARIDDDAVLDNVVHGVHKAAADAAARPGFERSSFSAAEGEASSEDAAFFEHAFADQPPLVVPTAKHRSKKKFEKLNTESKDFLMNAFRGDANDAFVRAAYGDGKFLDGAYEKTKAKQEKTKAKTAHHSLESAKSTETEHRLAKELHARKAAKATEARHASAEKKESAAKKEVTAKEKEISTSAHGAGGSAHRVEAKTEPSVKKVSTKVSRTGKHREHKSRRVEKKEKEEEEEEEEEAWREEEAQRQAEEIMAAAAKAEAHADSDFKATEVPREGEVQLACVTDESGAMHCEYPGAFDGETPITAETNEKDGKESKKSKSHSHHSKHHAKKEEASEGKKEKESRHSAKHGKAKLGAEIWKPVGSGREIPVKLHPFEADDMADMPAGVDM
jgi:hypothetical protein